MGSKIEDSEENKAWFFREVDTIHRIFNQGFEMDKHVSTKYYDALKRCRRDYLAEAMSAVIRGGKLPIPSDYLEAYRNVVKSHENDERSDRLRLAPAAPASPEDNLRIVVMSGMQLHYLHGWGIEAMPVESIKKAFDKMFPGEPFDFAKFKEKITQAVVENYFKSRNIDVFERSNPPVNANS